MIQHSLDAITKIEKLKIQTKKIKFNPDTYIIIRNIEIMISDLSKKEVLSRQTKKTYILDQDILKLNEAFTYLEQLILIATLVD